MSSWGAADAPRVRGRRCAGPASCASSGLDACNPDASHGHAIGCKCTGSIRSNIMKTLRRFLVALSLAGTIAGVLRMRGKGGVPPQEGGWREVTVPPK